MKMVHTYRLFILLSTAAARKASWERTLPLFDGFDQAGTLRIAQNCQKALTAEGGLTDVLEAIRVSLTPRLRETAYALAVDVAAIDLDIREEEDRILDIVKARFSIDPLAAAAIERAAAIRHRVED